MDIAAVLQELYLQKERLEKAIAALEDLQATPTSVGVLGGKRRGRKSMGAEERQEVSRRMTKYWASRRKQSQIEKK